MDSVASVSNEGSKTSNGTGHTNARTVGQSNPLETVDEEAGEDVVVAAPSDDASDEVRSEHRSSHHDAHVRISEYADSSFFSVLCYVGKEDVSRAEVEAGGEKTAVVAEGARDGEESFATTSNNVGDQCSSEHSLFSSLPRMCECSNLRIHPLNCVMSS